MRVQVHLMTAVLMMIVSLWGFIEALFELRKAFKDGAVKAIIDNAETTYWNSGLHKVLTLVYAVIDKKLEDHDKLEPEEKLKIENDKDLLNPTVASLLSKDARALYEKKRDQLKSITEENSKEDSIRMAQEFIDSLQDGVFASAVEHAFLELKPKDDLSKKGGQLIADFLKKSRDVIVGFFGEEFKKKPDTLEELKSQTKNALDGLAEDIADCEKKLPDLLKDSTPAKTNEIGELMDKLTTTNKKLQIYKINLAAIQKALDDLKMPE